MTHALVNNILLCNTTFIETIHYFVHILCRNNIPHILDSNDELLFTPSCVRIDC